MVNQTQNFLLLKSLHPITKILICIGQINILLEVMGFKIHFLLQN